MHDVEKHSAVLENAADFARLDEYIYIQSRNKMALFGVCLYIGRTNFALPEHCVSQNATSAEFLEVQIPQRVLVHDWEL